MSTRLTVICDGFPLAVPARCPDGATLDLGVGSTSTRSARTSAAPLRTLTTMGDAGWQHRLGRDLCPGCLERFEAERARRRERGELP